MLEFRQVLRGILLKSRACHENDEREKWRRFQKTRLSGISKHRPRSPNSAPATKNDLRKHPSFRFTFRRKTRSWQSKNDESRAPATKNVRSSKNGRHACENAPPQESSRTLFRASLPSKAEDRETFCALSTSGLPYYHKNPLSVNRLFGDLTETVNAAWHALTKQRGQTTNTTETPPRHHGDKPRHHQNITETPLRHRDRPHPDLPKTGRRPPLDWTTPSYRYWGKRLDMTRCKGRRMTSRPYTVERSLVLFVPG